MSNPTIARKEADSKMTIKDRILMAFVETGERETFFNITDFATSINMERNSFYQGLYALQRENILEIIVDKDNDGRKHIRGIRLQKAPTAHEIVARAMVRPAETTRSVKRTVSKINHRVPNTLEYLAKRQILDTIRDQISDAGYNPDEVLNLPARDSLAEESCFLYDELCNAQQHIAELEAQLNLAARLPKAIELPAPQGEPVMI